jgi:integrase
MPKLTKRTIDALPVRDKDYIVFDSEIPGFGVRVLPTGRKSYLVQYREGGRTRRHTIARHGAVTPDEARKLARQHTGNIAMGDNPSQRAQDYRDVPTVAMVCQRFIEEHVEQRLKPTTQREYRRAIDLFINPAFKTHKITDIERKDVSELHYSLRDKPYQANRVLQVLSKMFNLSEIWGLRPDGSNPCRHVPKYPERKRERFLSAVELLRLSTTLEEAEAEGTESPYVVAAFKLLILTGCRLTEIQTLKWSYISDTHINLPDSKTGARKIPLPPAAKHVLTYLPRVGTNDYVIVGDVPGQHVTDMQKPWRRIRKQAMIEDVRIHDLRHTYASNAVMQGLSIPMVGKLLGHTQVQTTMRYAHFSDDPVREAAEAVSNGLSTQMEKSEHPKPPKIRLVET